MSESQKLEFSASDQALYEKLDSTTRDLSDAISYGSFILKKGWKAQPWSRGSTYLQQSAFVTAMIVSYSRPFTRSFGWPVLPVKLPDVYDAEQLSLHRVVIEQRHKIYAHSDASGYPVIPYRSEIHSDITMHTTMELPHKSIQALIEMCRIVQFDCRTRQNTIKESY